MGRLHTETSTFGWLAPPDRSSEAPHVELQRSDNWPIPLVVRRQSGGGWREISADWFDAAERALYPSRNSTSNSNSNVIDGDDVDDGDGYQLVSRRRLRLAHALFVLLALAVVALIAWEVHTYFGVGRSLPAFR